MPADVPLPADPTAASRQPRATPVLPGAHPDPSVCRAPGDDLVWLATSTFEYWPAVALHSSTDLLTWTPRGSVVDRPGALDLTGVPDSGGVYAPTLRHGLGRWWLVSTVVGGDRPGSFACTADDPAGAWSDPVLVEGAEGIDPALFFEARPGDERDRVWWLGTRLRDPGSYEGETEIWLRELDPETLSLTGPEHVVWTAAQRGAVWSEGPHLVERDGWFHLVTAEGGTERHHAVVAARSRNVVGPYEVDPRGPLLTHRHLGRDHPVVAVGHADLVELPGGEWRATVLGMRPVGGHTVLGRETFVAGVTWEDDRPVVNAGVGQLDDAAVGHRPDPPEARVDDLRDARLPDGAWLSVRGAPSFAVPSVDGLVLDGGAAAGLHDQVGVPAFVGVRQRDHHETLELAVTVRPRQGGAAGLVVRQGGAHDLRVEVACPSATAAAATAAPVGLRVRVVAREAGVDQVLAEAAMPEPGRGPRAGSVPASPETGDGGVEVLLRASCRGDAYDLVALVVDPEGGAPVEVVRAAGEVRVVSTETAGGFVGVVWGAAVDGPGRLVLHRASRGVG